MKKYITNEPTPTTAPHKASIQKSPAQDSFVLITEVNGILTQGLNSAQLMRSLFEGSITPSDVVFKMVKSNSQEDSDFKVSSILSCPTTSESVQTVCNCLAIHVDAESATDSVQTSVNGEELS